MLELSHSSELLKGDVDSTSRPSSNALVREGQLLWQGVSAAPEQMQHAFSKEERAHTLENVAVSAGLTLVLSCLKRSPSLAWTAGRVIGPALTVSLLGDISARGNSIASAMGDTWQSDRNWKENVATAKENIGKFSADFAISAAASGFAERAGRSYFGLKSPGVNTIPELSRENLVSNWQRHMDGEIIPYRINSPQGGGARQVDLYVPDNIKHPDAIAGDIANGNKSGAGLLIAQDGLKIDYGPLKDLEAPEHGLVNLKADPSIDFVAAFTQPFRFRVVPGVNLAAWHHEGGLINPGGWFAPKTKFSDANFVADVQKTLSGIFNPDRTVLAGYSSGGILSNEVAARLGPSKINAVVSVASTVTGKELPASPGQFRLFMRDNGDPTLPQQGGAGGKAKILANLGHKSVLDSVPGNQINYGLEPYSMHELMSKKHVTNANVEMHSFALRDGTPVLSHIKANTGAHHWYTKESIAAPAAEEIGSPRENAAAAEELDLNQLVKEIVNGKLDRFRI